MLLLGVGYVRQGTFRSPVSGGPRRGQDSVTKSGHMTLPRCCTGGTWIPVDLIFPASWCMGTVSDTAETVGVKHFNTVLFVDAQLSGFTTEKHDDPDN